MRKIITAAIAAAATIAGVLPASADTITTDCQALRVGNTYERVCTSTVHRDPPAAVVDSGPLRGSASAELVAFDPIEEARKLAIPKHDPHPINLCPAPWHMTARDGCQR